MTKNCQLSLLILCCATVCGNAGQVSGTIQLQKKALKRAVASPIYDLRGMAASEPVADSRGGNQFDTVAVWLEALTTVQAPPESATMMQRNRRLEPELLIIPVGSTVQFPNMDPMFHNIFSLSHAQNFDLGYYPQGKSRTVTFRQAGIVQVYCHVHPSMYGAIVVTPSPWFVKPDSDGEFTFSGVTAGKYQLKVWQRFVGLFERQLEVPSSGNVRATVSLPMSEPQP